MPIPCPGNDTFNKFYGVGRNGANAFIAFIRALLVLVLELARDQELRRFLNQDCKEPCNKVVVGPTFRIFVSSLRPLPGGGWVCVIGAEVTATIQCVPPGGIDASDDQEMLGELTRHIQG